MTETHVMMELDRKNLPRVLNEDVDRDLAPYILRAWIVSRFQPTLVIQSMKMITIHLS